METAVFIVCFVLEGSVPGPRVFILCTADLSNKVKEHNEKFIRV